MLDLPVGHYLPEMFCEKKLVLKLNQIDQQEPLVT